MLIFVHMHKCAGTFVVDSAMRSGMILPQGHQNGNLAYDDGTPVLYNNLNYAEIRDMLYSQFNAGTEFLAMEWDFPKLDFIVRSISPTMFTVIRHPLARAISNFKMDKIFGWCSGGLSFTQYMDRSSYFRSDNYYVRKLARVPFDRDVCAGDVSAAFAALSEFEDVIVLERSDLKMRLRRLGFKAFPDAPVNSLSSNLKNFNADESELFVTDAEKDEFVKQNKADMLLYEYFS